MSEDVAAYRQAALWRRRAVVLLRDAQDALARAEAGMPVSLERVKVRRAIAMVDETRGECRVNLAVAERHVAELEAADV